MTSWSKKAFFDPAGKVNAAVGDWAGPANKFPEAFTEYTSTCASAEEGFTKASPVHHGGRSAICPKISPVSPALCPATAVAPAASRVGVGGETHDCSLIGLYGQPAARSALLLMTSTLKNVNIKSSIVPNITRTLSRTVSASLSERIGICFPESQLVRL